jgi:hypothetical protein
MFCLFILSKLECFTYFIQIPKTALWDEKIKRTQSPFQGHRFPVSEFDPFWDRNAPMETGQQRPCVIPFVEMANVNHMENDQILSMGAPPSGQVVLCV